MEKASEAGQRIDSRNESSARRWPEGVQVYPESDVAVCRGPKAWPMCSRCGEGAPCAYADGEIPQHPATTKAWSWFYTDGQGLSLAKRDSLESKLRELDAELFELDAAARLDRSVVECATKPADGRVRSGGRT